MDFKRYTFDSLSVNDIVLQTIRLNGIIVPITYTKYGYVKNPISDYDGDGRLEFMLKFSKDSFIDILSEIINTITITVQAENYKFSWTGAIEVKNQGKK